MGSSYYIWTREQYKTDLVLPLKTCCTLWGNYTKHFSSHSMDTSMIGAKPLRVWIKVHPCQSPHTPTLTYAITLRWRVGRNELALRGFNETDGSGAGRLTATSADTLYWLEHTESHDLFNTGLTVTQTAAIISTHRGSQWAINSEWGQHVYRSQLAKQQITYLSFFIKWKTFSLILDGCLNFQGDSGTRISIEIFWIMINPQLSGEYSIDFYQL